MNIELENKIMELVEAIKDDQFPEPEIGMAGPEYDAYMLGERIHSIAFNVGPSSRRGIVDVVLHLQWPRFHMLYRELKWHFGTIEFEPIALDPETLHVSMRVADSIITYVAILDRDDCIEMLMERGVPESTLEADLEGPACKAAAKDLWNEVLKYECL